MQENYSLVFNVGVFNMKLLLRKGLSLVIGLKTKFLNQRTKQLTVLRSLEKP